MNECHQVVRQVSIMLPHFHYDVPVLYSTDGRPYIPIFAVCQMLGIRVDRHIRRWQKLLFWITARKLPLYTPKRGRHLVWCLPFGDLPFLYICIDGRLISPERRIQLYQALEEGSKLSERAYQEMQNRYKATRHLLFIILTNFAGADANLLRSVEQWAPILEGQSRLWLNAHIEKGRSLFEEIADRARQMLHGQEHLPIVDALQVDPDGNVIDSFSTPLLPIVPQESSEQLFESIQKLLHWHVELAAFWVEQGPWPGGERMH